MTGIAKAVALLLALVLAIPASADAGKLTETEKRLIYSRAFEVTMWASPALAVYSQHLANQRDLGAHHLDIIYTGVRMDHRWGGITYNNQSPYFINHFSLKDGPVVLMPWSGRASQVEISHLMTSVRPTPPGCLN